MIEALRRKTAQLVGDPVLRWWLIGRALGRHPGPMATARGVPPYLDHQPPWGGAAVPVPRGFAELPTAPPTAPIELPLPGVSLRLAPGEEDELFAIRFDDLETRLAVHRFAWLPLMGEDVDPAWLNAIWRAWRAANPTPDGDWPWHAYTMAERVINILDYGRRHGLPGPLAETCTLLARHGRTIRDGLEYFGDHHTGNHLSNDGRGLYILGLALGIENFADTGARILLAEAQRIFLPSGILREGSSHYHLLLTRNYASAWLAARAHDRPEAAALADITRRALAALPLFAFPGGMPLIGDLSPDCPPAFLAGLFAEGDMAAGWCGLLPVAEREALAALKSSCPAGDADRLAADGWVRFEAGPWAGLCRASPDGWSPMPGHGHQDMGGFEVHFRAVKLFRDTGRGAYGDRGEAAAYLSARMHNTVMVDGHEPYPPNRPYYDAGFRRAVGGAPPVLRREDDGVSLVHEGFARLKGVGAVSRRWRFTAERMTIGDRIEGAGRHRIARRLHTTHAVSRHGDGLVIEGGGQRFRLTAEGDIALATAKCWVAYGRSVPSTAIELFTDCELPMETEITVEVM